VHNKDLRRKDRAEEPQTVPSVTRVARRKQPDKRNRVEQALLEATERLIDGGCSFTELSVEQLATEAGIARSTFYVYFVDKSELVRRLADRVIGDMVAAFAPWWAVAGQAVWDDLYDAMRAMLDVYDRHRAVLAALIETAAYDAAAAALADDMLQRVVDESRRGYDRIKSAGKLNPGVSRETAEVLSLMVEHTCRRLGRQASSQRRKALAEALTHVAWSSLYDPSVPQRRRSATAKPQRRQRSRARA
jgi:AcrR family transcriptional regulator